MIENARGMVDIERIARAGEGYLDGLLFAAEDCGSSSFAIALKMLWGKALIARLRGCRSDSYT